jgi:hypothetical protein
LRLNNNFDKLGIRYFNILIFRTVISEPLIHYVKAKKKIYKQTLRYL